MRRIDLQQFAGISEKLARRHVVDLIERRRLHIQIGVDFRRRGLGRLAETRERRELVAGDPSEAFASELCKIPSGQPNAAINAHNRAYHGAKTSDARDRVERIWRDFQARYDSRGSNPFAPRQPAHDAPWSSLYAANPQRVTPTKSPKGLY
jgi:hypothetical protein